jgi:hypothetical protein
VVTYFVPRFRKAKFCVVPSRATVKVGCAVGINMLQNTDAGYISAVNICNDMRRTSNRLDYCFPQLYSSHELRGRVVNTAASYSEHKGFKSRHRYRIS